LVKVGTLDAMGSGAAPGRGYGEGREALLDAAARVVARDGMSGLTYRSVAREAGVVHGLVAYHFGSRDQLIHETATKAWSESVDVTALDPDSGRLEDFSRQLSRLAAEQSGAQAFQYELAVWALRSPELRGEAQDLYAEWRAAIERTLARLGLDGGPVLARLVFAALDGLVLQQLIFERPEETDAAIEQLVELLELKREQTVPARDPAG
jgi:AcrR family transcriptional regulator